jgi:hypothetical protein
VPVRQCRTVNGYETRVVGYDVVYEYHGQRYSTRLPNDPGPRLAIDVRPTAGAPLDRVGPPASYGAVPPAYAQAAPSYSAPSYGEAPRPTTTRRRPYYAPAPVYYTGLLRAVLRRAGGDRPRHRLLGRRTWHRGYRNGWHGHRGWR